jgi:hypothetical protein
MVRLAGDQVDTRFPSRMDKPWWSTSGEAITTLIGSPGTTRCGGLDTRGYRILGEMAGAEGFEPSTP